MKKNYIILFVDNNHSILSKVAYRVIIFWFTYFSNNLLCNYNFIKNKVVFIPHTKNGSCFETQNTCIVYKKNSWFDERTDLTLSIIKWKCNDHFRPVIDRSRSDNFFVIICTRMNYFTLSIVNFSAQRLVIASLINWLKKNFF